MQKLTQALARSLRPGASPIKVSDGGGLFLHVRPSGVKTWRYSYRHGGKQKTVVLGRFPELSIEMARQQHGDLRTLVASGADPVEEKILVGRIFEEAAREWHQRWAAVRTEKHAAQVWRRLELDVFPAIGARTLVSLTASDFRKTIQSIEDRGAAEIARRNLHTCGQILRFCVSHDYVERNVVSDLKPSDILRPMKRRNFPRVSTAELPQLLRDIDGYIGDERTKLGLQLLALTFVRTAELIGAPWTEIDFEAARWEIPGERMKMDRPHVVPLSRQAIAVLRRLKELSYGSQWVLPHERKPDHLHMSNNTLLYALYRLGYRGRMTGHGFRSVASTILYEQRFDPKHIEMQLAHAETNEVVAAYNKAEYLEDRTTMMQAWADHLDVARLQADKQ
ncbi:MAG: tyrosine-type recombinase/integrase [Pigmentiphaga sp.]